MAGRRMGGSDRRRIAAVVALVVLALWLSPGLAGPWALLLAFGATPEAPLPGLRSPLTWLAVLALLVSHLGAADAWASWLELGGWAGAAVAFAAGGALSRAARPAACGRAFAWVATALGAACSAHAIWQVCVLHPRLLAAGAALDPRLSGQLGDGRANSIFLLPGQLGGLLAAASVACVAGLAAALLEGRRLEAGGLAAGLALMLAGLGSTRSMASALLLGLGLAALAVLALRGRARAILVGIGLLLALVLGGASALSRATEIEGENPAGARAANWLAASRLIAERPVIGWGGGAFAHEYPRVRPEGANAARHAHEVFLETAAEHGVTMALLLLALVATVAGRVRRSCAGASGPAERFVLAAPGAAAAVLISHGLVDFGWSRPEWSCWAALVLGLAAAGGRLATATVRARRLDLAVAFGLAAFAFTSAWAASRESRGLERVREAALAGDHVRAAELASELRRRLPWSSATWAIEAEARLAAGERRGVAALAEEAARLSPRRGAVQALRARALLAEGRRMEAWIAAERAAALGPTVPDWLELREALRPPGEE